LMLGSTADGEVDLRMSQVNQDYLLTVETAARHESHRVWRSLLDDGWPKNLKPT